MSQIRVKDYTGKVIHKKKRGFTTKKEALEWERDFLASLQYDSSTTFGSIAEDFMMEITPRRRKTTIRTYRIALAHILPTFKSVPMADISEKMIVLWQNELISKNLSDVFSNKIDTMFRTIFKYGAKR